MKITDDFDSIELSEQIFKDVKYYVTGKLPQKVTSLLNDGGAKKTNYISEIVTHCIAGEDFDESEIAEAKDIYEIQSVTWKWVILSARCGTLLPVKGFLAEKTQLFSGVVACVSLLSQEDNNALWAMLNFYGGELVTKLSKSCTHLIVSRPTGAKFERALKEKEKNQKIEIVTPDWVIESVKIKSRCDESLFHPSLLILAEERRANDSLLASSLADITGFAEPEPAQEAQPAVKSASGVLDPTRYEKLMEMLDQRKQQEEKVNIAQQQLSNIQLQQQQLLQQQKQQQMQQQQQQQQQQQMPQEMAQQPQMVQRPQMAQQPQQMMQQQPQMVQQPQQMQQQPQQGMIPQQQQQRFQFVQQQQYAQQRMQQGAIIQGQQGQRIMLTQQQLQQRAMQGSMQFRAPRYIIADGKQYVINSAQQAQQVANLVQGVQGAVQMQDQQQQQQQMQPQMQQPQQNIQGVQQQPQQHFANTAQVVPQGNVVPVAQTWQQGQPQQQQQQQQFQMQQQPQQQQQMPQQFQMQQHPQQMQVNQQQQQMQMQQQQPQQVAGAMQMNQGVQQVVSQLQGQPGQMQGQPGQMQGQVAPMLGQHPIQGQMQGQVVPIQGQVSQIQQVGQMQGQVTPVGQMQGQVTQVGQMQGQVTQVGQMQGQMQQQGGQQTTPQRLLWQQTTPQGHRQYFQLDPQTHQQLQAMDPAQRQIFIQKLQKRQQLIQLQQQQAQARLQQQQAGGVAVQGVPGAPRQPLTPQQQAALRQQFQQQQRMGLSPQWREGGPNQQGPRTVLIQGQQQIVVQAGIPRPQQPMAVSSPQATPTQGQQQHWTPGTPGTPQQAGTVSAPVQTVQTAGIQTPGTQMVQGANLPQDEAQRQLLLRQQQMRRLQMLKAQQALQAAQAGQVVPGQAVQANQVVPGQVVPGPRMGTPPFAVAQGAVPGQVPQQVVAAQQAATPVEDGSASNSGTSTPQPATADGQVGTPTQPQQFQQLLVNAKTKTALANMLSSRLQSGGAGEATPASVQLRLMTQQHQQQQQRPPQPGVAAQQVAMAPQQLPQQPGAAGVGVGVNAPNQQFLLTYQQRGRGTAGPNQPTQLLVRNQSIVQYTSTRVLALNQQGAANVPAEGAQPQAAAQQPNTIQIQFYGHSPNMKVPPNLCLLGCVFMIAEYSMMYSTEELDAWRNQIVNHGGEVENFYTPRITHFVCPHQRSPLAHQALREGKRLVSAFWLNDVLIKQRMLPPWQALHHPLAFNEDTRPLKKFIITSSGFSTEEKERIKYIVSTLGGRYTPYLTKENKVLICRKAEGKKYNQARTWRTTIVNAHWLHEIMLGQFRALHASGYAKYQQFNDNPLGLDYSIVPHLMIAWKVPVAISPESLERGKLLQQQHIASGQLNNPKKRPAPIPIEQANKMDRPDSKIIKLEEPAQNGDSAMQQLPAEPETEGDKVFFQLSYVTKRDELKKQLEELGGVFTKDYDKLTHLVMKDAERTEKLLCAISKAKYVVSEKWVLESAAHQKFLDPEPFIFSNTNLEQHYSFSFKELMKKPNRSQLFKDRVFYLSPGCTPYVHVIEDIIVCAGGQVEKKRRPASFVQEANKAKPNSYIILADANDLHLVVDYINADIDIYSAEMVYSSIFKQSLDLTDQHKIVLR